MDHHKIDLTETVDLLSHSAVPDQSDFDANEKRRLRQAMLELILPAVDAFESAVRVAVAEEIRNLAKDRERVRPLRLDAETATDFADDLEWAAMLVEKSLP